MDAFLYPPTPNDGCELDLFICSNIDIIKLIFSDMCKEVESLLA